MNKKCNHLVEAQAIDKVPMKNLTAIVGNMTSPGIPPGDKRNSKPFLRRFNPLIGCIKEHVIKIIKTYAKEMDNSQRVYKNMNMMPCHFEGAQTTEKSPRKTFGSCR